jgi:hypothetical protein
MIRKDDLIMSNKKDFTIKELAQQCEEAKKNFEALSEQLKKAQQDEEDRKKAQLALEKENRKKKVDDAFENYRKLLKAYIEDYGSYHTESASDDWFSSPFWKGFF